MQLFTGYIPIFPFAAKYKVQFDKAYKPKFRDSTLTLKERETGIGDSLRHLAKKSVLTDTDTTLRFARIDLVIIFLVCL